MAQPALVTSSAYKIEKSVPLPAGGSGTSQYPFPMMEVGDSVVLPAKGTAAAYTWGKIHNVKFSCRTEGVNTVRVWRTA